MLAYRSEQKFLGSNIVRKYPRCSRRNMRVYSDAEADYDQMRMLATTWLSFFTLGQGDLLRPNGLLRSALVSKKSGACLVM